MARPSFEQRGGDYKSFVDLGRLSLRTRYVLGYTPANAARDGKYRRVKVLLVPAPPSPE